MSTLAGPPVRLADALGSHAKDIARAAWVRLPAESRRPRDLAFAAYRRRVRRVMRGDTCSFRVVGTRTVASSSRSTVVEVELRTRAEVGPGDMLYVWWRNDPARLASLDPGLADAELGYWTTPVPHRPARRSRATAARLAASVFDLSALRAEEVGALGAEGLLALPRITPRLYTASEARRGADGGGVVKVQVTMREEWPRRAAAFLHRADPGDEFRAWVMPHPNRVDRGGPGVAVVTGSGAAGVFAALRGGARGIDLVWGLGEKRPEAWILDELRGYELSGALASLRLVTSPTHVGDALREMADLGERSRRGDWLYVSGNEAAGADAHAALVDLLGDEAVRRAADSLRYINS